MAKDYLSVGLPKAVAADIKATAKVLGRTQMSMLVDAWAHYRASLGDHLRQQADNMDAGLQAAPVDPRIGKPFV